MPQSPCTPNMVVWGAREPRDLVSAGFAREACIFQSQNHGFSIIYNTILNKSLPKPMGIDKKISEKTYRHQISRFQSTPDHHIWCAWTLGHVWTFSVLNLQNFDFHGFCDQLYFFSDQNASFSRTMQASLTSYVNNNSEISEPWGFDKNPRNLRVRGS